MGNSHLRRMTALAALAIAFPGTAWGQPENAAQGEERVRPRVEEAVWGPQSDPALLRNGDVATNPAGESRVIVRGRFRPEIWKIGKGGAVVDVGYFTVGERKDAIRVEWEKSPPVEWPVLAGGVLPWKRTGKRFDAFRLSDWLVGRKEPVGLPFFGRKNVGFAFGEAGLLRAALKDGGTVSGRWWWSRGRLHLELDGLDDVGTYEWRSLASRVGWTGRETGPAVTGAAVRPLASIRRNGARDRVLARTRDGCPRNVLRGLLSEAAERSDVVSAIAIEKETIALCAERQAVVADLLRAEGQIEDALAKARERRNPGKASKGIRSVAQLVGLEIEPRPEPRGGSGRAALVAATGADARAAGKPGSTSRTTEPTKPVRPPAAPAKVARPDYRWFSVVGRKGSLLAGVTDGRRTWFVAEGDVLPGTGRVRRIAGRPPGVRVAGLGLLPWAGKAAPGRIRAAAETAEPDGAAETVEAAEAPRSPLSGRARAVDGDTLEIGGVRVRLWGIDAPESRQRCRAGGQWWSCGGLATAALRARSGNVECERRGTDAYGRVVAVCFERGEDIAGWLVAEGWALAWRRHARDYVPHEERARASRKGMHRGEFVAPWDWRRGVRLRAAAPRDGKDRAAGAPPRGALPALPDAGGTR